MDRLLLMHSFARAVETGSFSAVARELATGQPNVSRHIAALERHLGVRLLHRSTRKLTLTPEGERYYAEARRALDAIAEAESNARGDDAPKGLLRVACPTLLGRSHILPQLKAILARFPAMEIDLQIGDRYVDLVEEGIDIAIRIGTLKDSALIARRIGSAERFCVASTDYLAERPRPLHPEDLRSHQCVVYTLSSAGNIWSFRDVDVAVRGRFCVNTPDGVRSAALDGLGIAYAPRWLFEDGLVDGRLQSLLVDHLGPPLPIQFVYAANRLLPRRARVFMDFIADVFARDPTLNAASSRNAPSTR
ncbi:MAG: LysR substrate-binding domain-containing protein [Steroidobacteraceae bacterium]